MSALDEQIDGQHYKTCKIQPIEYMYANNLSYPEGAIVKYITRHRNKGKANDIRKIIHFCKLILELEYKETYDEGVPSEQPNDDKPRSKDDVYDCALCVAKRDTSVPIIWRLRGTGGR